MTLRLESVVKCREVSPGYLLLVGGALVSVKVLLVAHTEAGHDMGGPVAESSRNTSVLLPAMDVPQ